MRTERIAMPAPEMKGGKIPSAGSHSGASRKTRPSILAALLFLGLAACRSPVYDTASTDNATFRFLVSGTQGAADASSRLLLPTAATLTVSLTPQKTSAKQVPSKSVALSAGQSSVDLSFSLSVGESYAIRAQALDRYGAIVFQQNSTFTLGDAGGGSVSMALVPYDPDPFASLALNASRSGSLIAGKSATFVVPASAMSSARFGLSVLSGTDAQIQCFIQDQNGASLSADSSSRQFIARTSGSGYAFVTLYNGDGAQHAYSIKVVTPTEAGGIWTITEPASNTVSIAMASTTLRYGFPVAVTASYSGGGSPVFSWSVDGTAFAGAAASSSGAVGTFAFVPSVSTLSAGTHTIKAQAVDGTTGIAYSGSATFTAASNAPASDGLIGEWLFQGNTLDTSGSGCSGTVSGTYGTDWSYAAGRKGSDKALDLGASVADTASVSGAGYAFAHGQSFSVSVWIKPVTLYAGGSACILGAQAAGKFGWALKLSNPGSGTLTLIAGDASSANYVSVSASGLSANNWHHVLLVYDGSRLTGYLDGTSIGQSSAYSYADAPTGGGFELTNAYVSPANNFQTCFEQLRIYGCALTDTQAEALYHE